MVTNAKSYAMIHANVKYMFSSNYLVAIRQRRSIHVGSHHSQSVVTIPVIKYCLVGTNVLAIAFPATKGDCINTAILHVVVFYLVAIFVSFHVLMNVPLAMSLVGTTAITAGAIRSVVSLVPPVWRIVGGSVNTLNVPRNVVSHVTAIAVIVLALDF